MARRLVLLGCAAGLVGAGVWAVAARRDSRARQTVATAASNPVVSATPPATPPARVVPRAIATPTRRLMSRVATPVRIDDPELADAVIVAETAWTAAEASPTPELWDAAADHFARAIASCHGHPHCVELAYAECLARANAVRIEDAAIPEGEAPVPLPPRVDAMVDAMDRFVDLAPDSEEAPGMRFLAARTYWKHRHLNDATIARLEVLVFAPEPVEVTEYSINLLLDTLIRLDRIDDLRRVVDRLLADHARIAAFPDIVARLQQLRAMH
jgi:hypothetical protein